MLTESISLHNQNVIRYICKQVRALMQQELTLAIISYIAVKLFWISKKVKCIHTKKIQIDSSTYNEWVRLRFFCLFVECKVLWVWDGCQGWQDVTVAPLLTARLWPNIRKCPYWRNSLTEEELIRWWLAYIYSLADQEEVINWSGELLYKPVWSRVDQELAS